MKKIYKKLSIIFIMVFTIMLGCFSNVFAADDGVVGTANLNGTIENSAKIGDQLTSPEKGWKRYQTYTNSDNVHYEGIWDMQKGTNAYYTYKNNLYIKFNFVGSKIRFFKYKDNYSSSNISVTIDGKNYKSNNSNISNGDFNLIYEINGLNFGEHNVIVDTSTAASYLHMDLECVDIDSTGKLKAYNENLENITLNKTTSNLQVGQTDTLIATITPGTVTNKTVTWKSSDESIATVDSTGKVTVVKEGTVTITATTTDGSNLSASCTVTVTPQGTTPTQPTNPADNTGNAILTITMTNGNVKSYTVPMIKVSDFINWYDNRVGGSAGKAYYIFDKTDSSQTSFSKKTEYIIFDKISSYEVDEYTK